MCSYVRKMFHLFKRIFSTYSKSQWTLLIHSLLVTLIKTRPIPALKSVAIDYRLTDRDR